jgi:membrane protein implicated in regulation of membrane protease activity
MIYWHYWLSAGIILLVLEMLVPGFFLFSFGVASIITGLVAYLGGNMVIQLSVFCFSSLVIFLSLRPVFQRYFVSENQSVLTGPESLIGKRGRVTVRIENVKNSGRVNVNGEDWKALSSTGEDIEEGQSVVVLKVESINLIVAKFDKGD